MSYSYSERPRQWIKTYEGIYVNTNHVEYFRIREGDSNNWMICADTRDEPIIIQKFSLKDDAQKLLDQLIVRLGLIYE